MLAAFDALENLERTVRTDGEFVHALKLFRDPEQFAAYTDHLLRNPSLAATMRSAAAERGRRYTWSFAAARLRRVYTDITARSLVNCS